MISRPLRKSMQDKTLSKSTLKARRNTMNTSTKKGHSRTESKKELLFFQKPVVENLNNMQHLLKKTKT